MSTESACILDRVMVITGASKGIGRYLVERYLGQGYRVVGLSRSAADDCHPGQNHARYEHCIADVADEAAVHRIFASIRRRYGRLDVLLNNAGVASMNHSLLTPVKAARRLLETNVVGTFLCAREAAKIMKMRSYGRIVNFSSFAVPFKLEGEAIYAASKAAVETLSEVLAREYGPYGVRVNVVAPPAVATDLTRGIAPPKLTALLRRTAVPRLGEASEVGDVIDFFIDQRSDMITGQKIYMGGP